MWRWVDQRGEYRFAFARQLGYCLVYMNFFVLEFNIARGRGVGWSA